MQKQTGNSGSNKQNQNQIQSQGRDQVRDQGSNQSSDQSSDQSSNQSSDQSSKASQADVGGASVVDRQAVQGAGQQQQGSANAQKVGEKTDKSASKSGDKSSDKSADSSLNSKLPEVLQHFNTDEVKRYADRAFHYAEAKPMQTLGVTIAGGAILGWLLTSRSGRSAVASVGTIVMPFVMSWVKQNVDFSKIGQEITEVVHH
jgi:ElaB/YqjD/DUF883 family membrane-anchored ribosome-binding protein